MANNDHNPTTLKLQLHGFIKVVRPKQWIKNLLVFMAPAAAGILLHPAVLAHALGAFGIFCLAASGVYLLNDTIDAPADRIHPTKCNRPIASGIIRPGQALLAAAVLLLTALIISEVVYGWELVVVMATYVAINIAYAAGLKREAIIDLACVSAGFVLRAIAGGVATSVPLTDWFLIVVAAGSLLIVTGKRSGEKVLLDQIGTEHHQVRASLGVYTPSFLRSVRTFAASITTTAYCLWAFQRASVSHLGRHALWYELSIIPVIIILLHLLQLLESGQGAAPEELAIHDHRLQIYGLIWVALFAAALYG